MTYYIIGVFGILVGLYALIKVEVPFLRLGSLIPVLVGMYSLTVPTQQAMMDKDNKVKLVEAKKIASCKLIEENINNGFFQSNTNKLDCDGVIRNIPVSEYDTLMEKLKGK